MDLTTKETSRITHWSNGDLLYEGPGTLKEVLEAAVAAGANLDGANLGGANLDGANLDGANLDGANLRGANLRGAYLGGAYLDDDTTLPLGVTWREYRDEVLPWLLAAGGKTLESYRTVGALACHDWDNCLMAHDFDAHSLDDIPTPYRPWAELTIQLFDVHLLDEILEALIPGGETNPS